MGIDYRPLRNLSTRDMIAALNRDGFVFDGGEGSHQVYYHPDGRRVTVMFHGNGKTFTRKTLKSMVETEARWTEHDLRRLKLIK